MVEGRSDEGEPEPRIDVVLPVLDLDPSDAARTVDVLSRTVLGLALDGVSSQLRVDQSACELRRRGRGGGDAVNTLHAWYGAPCHRCGTALLETWERYEGRWELVEAYCPGECGPILTYLFWRRWFALDEVFAA